MASALATVGAYGGGKTRTFPPLPAVREGSLMRHTKNFASLKHFPRSQNQGGSRASWSRIAPYFFAGRGLCLSLKARAELS